MIIECLEEIKNEGLIEHIGISIYTPEEAEEALKFREIYVIQVPINIFDQRLIKTGMLKRLKKKNYIIFARSIYLQGLFFLSPEDEKLQNNVEAKAPLKRLHNLSKEYDIHISPLALSFVNSVPEIDSMVIGSEKIEQIAENLEILNGEPLKIEIYKLIIEEFSEISETVINPSLWNK